MDREGLLLERETFLTTAVREDGLASRLLKCAEIRMLLPMRTKKGLEVQLRRATELTILAREADRTAKAALFMAGDCEQQLFGDGDLEAGLLTCEWFALCENVATATEPHPILGSIPICERCKAKLEAMSS